LARFTGNAAADLHQWEANGQVLGTDVTMSNAFPEGVHSVAYRATTLTPDGDACSATSSVLFRVTVEPQLLIPNAITPNNDGINDVLDFQVAGLSEMTFQVFNRWGFLVYSQENSARSWGGVDSNGNPLPEGVYTYNLVYRATFNDKQYSKQGTVTIIR
jgi:gliding motility-associated-like protein